MVESSLNKAAQVLVVEDEAEIRELISLLLLRQGHRVEQCSTAKEGLIKLKQTRFDLIVLDWMLPEMNGIEFMRIYREDPSHQTPILMVTAKTEPQDIVNGLEAGADDYLTKPFEPSILNARVKSLLRRSKNIFQPEKTPEDQIQIGQMNVNLSSYTVSCAGEDIHLTPSEFKLLVSMAQNRGRVMTRDHLIEVVQGEGISVVGRTVDTHVFGLRKKLGTCSELIETIRGIGYRIRSEA